MTDLDSPATCRGAALPTHENSAAIAVLERRPKASNCMPSKDRPWDGEGVQLQQEVLVRT
jgi:hypothetical protein